MTATTTPVNVVPKRLNKNFFSLAPPSLRQEKDVKHLTWQSQKKIQPTTIITKILEVFCDGVHSTEFIIPDYLSKCCIIIVLGARFGWHDLFAILVAPILAPLFQFSDESV